MLHHTDNYSYKDSEMVNKEPRECCILLTLLPQKLDGGEIMVKEQRRCCLLLTLLP